ncbi:MFS general substrate transporter [Cladorrhinum sp. PSN332]|nr:MFS general substrate transporter [Cladorrhinum sp. PSN332]
MDGGRRIGVIPRWSFGVLNPKDTTNVPGSVLLLVGEHTSDTLPEDEREMSNRKTTNDGAIILDPQPDNSPNDPLNWPRWRRDVALVTLGLYCMLGGGITPLLAAAFTEISKEYDVPVTDVSLTTGLIMLGLGVGCVLVSPTAIIYGKRPVYLASAVLFLLTAVWCALSPSFPSLLVARVIQGIAVSPVEALPSASITEMFFLHERAFRIGIYGLMLLGGKNLVPLVSAAIINSMGWRWAFWIMATMVGFIGLLLFLFSHETFWDRNGPKTSTTRTAYSKTPPASSDRASFGPAPERSEIETKELDEKIPEEATEQFDLAESTLPAVAIMFEEAERTSSYRLEFASSEPPDSEKGKLPESPLAPTGINTYPEYTKAAPPESFVSNLRPWRGRLREQEKWLQVACRPFLLFTYPAILWSAAVYSCCIGWLVVISESMDIIYRGSGRYHFTALQTGLVYVSPFIGGVLGSAVAGKLSDMIVRAMARRNDGVYEPEFRLVMAIPVTICTVLGLMGFGWSAQDTDLWIVPTVFFGIISFGCALGSTTAITYCVDSYRQFAGEALVTLNFSKNIFHGLVFSLFITKWLRSEGSREVYSWIGVIQLILLLFTIPMFIFGKRARLWTSRQHFHQIVTCRS